jgi:hypothetical protein
LRFTCGRLARRRADVERATMVDGAQINDFLIKR